MMILIWGSATELLFLLIHKDANLINEFILSKILIIMPFNFFLIIQILLLLLDFLQIKMELTIHLIFRQVVKVLHLSQMLLAHLVIIIIIRFLNVYRAIDK